MPKRTIYVVLGETGEYSDRREWMVAAVETEDAAKSLVEALGRQFQSVPPSLTENRWEKEDEIKAIMTLDPNFSLDYTGTSYFYGSVNFITGREIKSLLAAA